MHRTEESLTVHTGGLVARRPSHLPRQTGALDRLGSLLDAILVAAPVGGDHFAGASLCGGQKKEQRTVSVALAAGSPPGVRPLSRPRGMTTIGVNSNRGNKHMVRPAVGNTQCRGGTISRHFYCNCVQQIGPPGISIISPNCLSLSDGHPHSMPISSRLKSYHALVKC